MDKGKYILITAMPFVEGMLHRARQISREHGGNFRAPHSTVSSAGMGSELALAAGGVLFLDEVPDFSQAAISTIKNIWPMMDPKVRPLIIAGVRWLNDLKTGELASEDLLRRALVRVSNMFEGWDVVEHHQGCR